MSRARGALSLLALAVGALFVVVAAALVVGVGGSAGPDGSATDDTAADTAVPERPRRSPNSTVAPPVVGDVFTLPTVMVSAAMPYGTPTPAIGRLSSRSVLDISASGFPPSVPGRVEQCGVGGCANDFPITFDANGEVRFQYLAYEDFGRAFHVSSACRADDPPCVVKVSASGRTAYLTTVFGDAAPQPRRVALMPGAAGLVDGAPVRVTVTGFRSGEDVQAMLCAAPATSGPARCGAPGPVAQFTIGSDGTGATTLVLREGPVGSQGARCGRGSQPCGVVVVDARSAGPGAVVAFDFDFGPGANYERNRLAIGFIVALCLFALAAYLVRTTDWRKPSEADTPELDRATLFD